MLLSLLLFCTPVVKDTSVEDTKTCFGSVPSIFIGEGEQSFIPFVDPAEAIMVHGPQGGWHILASIRLENMESIVEVGFQVVHQPTGVLVSDNQYRLAVISDGECAGYYPGMYGYLSVSELYDGDLDTPPELLGGDVLKMTIAVNDCLTWMEEAGDCVREQCWATEEIEVIAILDPIDQE
jgi:hypothetical protein